VPKKGSKGLAADAIRISYSLFFVSRSTLSLAHALRALDGFGLIQPFHRLPTQAGGNMAVAVSRQDVSSAMARCGWLVAKDALATVSTATVQASW
jgi:hypothetical protein